MPKNKIRWGIIGLGSIAHKFALALGSSKDAVLYGVASRDSQKADTFREKYKAVKAYGDYDSIIHDKDVDIVYIATPHPQHHGIAKQALEMKKAVLCEKPVTLNFKEANELIEIAKKNNVFFMEAMWTHCFPLITKVKEMLMENKIGNITHVESNFCVLFNNRDEKSRAFNPMLGGGALLDIGVYPISLTQLLFGIPLHIESNAKIGSTGVDEENEIHLYFPHSIKAVLKSSLNFNGENYFQITGTKGKILIEPPFWQPTKLKINNRQTEIFPTIANGYEYEAEEATRCLQNNEIESKLVTHKATLETMKTLDLIRKQWGLVYPMEKEN